MYSPKIVVVLPAYNAAKTLQKTLDDIPRDLVNDIILVDDASTDGTAELARSLGLKTFVHKKNKGYGANQKTCYREALAIGADIIIMVHPDHQYDPRYIPQIVEPILRGEAEAVFGSRMMVAGWALQGGMPYWKYIANKVLTIFENMILGTKLTEFHSGFRAYSSRALTAIPLECNSDSFVFDTEIIVQLVLGGYTLKEVPIATRYFKDASSISFLASVCYGLDIIVVMCRYIIHRWGIRRFPQFSLYDNYKR